MATDSQVIIALDIGERRVGVASCNMLTKMPQPLATIELSESSLSPVIEVIKRNGAETVVVGLPRGLNGQDTAQTKKVETIANDLRSGLEKIPVYLQDEAATSIKAEEELKSRGGHYDKGDIDALSAVYILEDFIRDHDHELKT